LELKSFKQKLQIIETFSQTNSTLRDQNALTFTGPPGVWVINQMGQAKIKIK